MPASEKVRGLFIDGPSNIYNETLAKIVSKVNSKLLTILTKKYNLDIWLGPGCVSVGGKNTTLEIQTEISPGQQLNMESF